MTPDLCPYCSKPLHVGIQPVGRRICSVCGLPIRKKHKWQIGNDAKIRHKNCQNPTGNIDTNESKGLF